MESYLENKWGFGVLASLQMMSLFSTGVVKADGLVQMQEKTRASMSFI